MPQKLRVQPSVGEAAADSLHVACAMVHREHVSFLVSADRRIVWHGNREQEEREHRLHFSITLADNHGTVGKIFLLSK